jgi:hypothetical protein
VNLSLVPQALSGHLPEDRSDKVERAIAGAIKRRREPNLARGIRKTFMGIAFLMVVVALFFRGGYLGFGEIVFLIPAFLLLGKGIGEIVNVMSIDYAKQRAIPPSAPRTNELPSHPIYNPLAPPSVTEGTTRHMDPGSERGRETN